MNEPLPITKDSEICRVLSCLPEKFVVDFANGIDVARDHSQVQKARGSFGARLLDGFSGQGGRRQSEINTSLIDGVEASLNWLIDLSESLAHSNLAIARVNDRVNALKLDLAIVADYSATTRRQLEALSTRLDERCDAFQQEITRIGLVQRAQINLDEVFNKWAAGRYRSFSLSGRCYAALEELRWGAFGDYCRSPLESNRQHFINDLANRAIAQLAKDADKSGEKRIATHNWLTPPVGDHVLIDSADALAYMGNGMDGEHYPFIFSVSQRPNDLPFGLPLLSSAERVSEALVSEVFGEYAYA
jgi:phage host-nuclease inhibitor protein Gam